MRVLVDTNVIMDYIANREPYVSQAYKIIELCVMKIIDGCMSAHTVLNLFYILRKDLSVAQRKKILSQLCRVLTVINIDEVKIANALKNNSFDDIEDCLQDECARSFQADYLITRNVKDFSGGKIKAIEPVEFLLKL